MAYEGAIVTAAATWLASAAFLLASTGTRPSRTGRQTGAISLFFAISSLFLFMSGARQLFAYGATTAPALSDMDRILFLLLVVPAAAAIVPLVHLASRMLWGNKRRSQIIAAVFVLLVLAGLVATFVGGITGPMMTYWGSEWELQSPIAKGFLIGVVTLPAIASSITILVVGNRLRGPERRRILVIGGVFLVYYVVFTTDALGLPGVVLVIERLITAATAVVAYLVYRRPGPDATRPVRPPLPALEPWKNTRRRGPGPRP